MLRPFLIPVAIMMLLGFVALIAAAFVRRKRLRVLQYEKADALFTPAERSFLGVLDQAVGANFRVFGKVRIADVLNVSKMGSVAQRTIAFNKISAKHFDFVICRADDLSVVCALELDDKSHSAARRKKRDEFVETACRDSTLPLVRVAARSNYVLAEIRSQVLAAMHEKEPTDQTPSATEAPTVKCPKCSSDMQRHQLTSGAKAGTSFWRCKDFPSCRGCVPVSNVM